MMTQRDGTPLARNVMWFNDFYSTSECRDLLFHVQEHRMTLPEIRRSSRAQGLTFLGFEVDRDDGAALCGALPGRPGDDRPRSVARVRAGSVRYTFASMYRFWVQKPA